MTYQVLGNLDPTASSAPSLQIQRVFRTNKQKSLPKREPTYTVGGSVNRYEMFTSICEQYQLPSGSAIENPPAIQKSQEMRVRSLGQEDPLEEGMATHSSIVSWRISWTEEPGGLRSIGSHRLRHN